MKGTTGMLTLVLLAVSVAGHQTLAQTRPTETTALRANLERRFDVLPLRDGVALRPKDTSLGIRSIEVTEGPISVDGQPATGAELRQRLGADADVILELSYLTADQRRALFSDPQTPTTVIAPPAERRAPDRAARRSRSGRGSDRIRVGGSVSVGDDEVVEGDVVAVGGSVSVDGEVHGDVVAVGGSVTLGPRASVSNNVVVVGGSLNRDPASRIGGRVQEVGIGNFDLGSWRWSANPLWMYWGSMFGPVLALVGILTRLAILCLLAALVLLVGPEYAGRAGDHAVREPLKSGGVGFLAQVLFLPVLVITIVVLVVTIVGIPLLLLVPFLLLGLVLVGLVGFTGVVQRLGALVGSRLGWSNNNPYITTILGIGVLHLPALLARIVGLGGGVMFPLAFGFGLVGILVEYLAWTIGFGAVVLARFNRTATPVPLSVGVG